LVKTTTHRRTTSDQNTLSDLDNTIEYPLSTDDHLQTDFLSGEHFNDVEKKKNKYFLNSPNNNTNNNTNSLSIIQNNLSVENSTKTSPKSQLNNHQSNDLQLCVMNKKIINPVEKSSQSSCYATLHE
ncbi:unnamed protein product, partial [Schistosoma turkestanicum]